jgi:ATP synthase protein I
MLSWRAATAADLPGANMNEKQGGDRASQKGGNSFEERLRTARTRQGLEGPPKGGRFSDPLGGTPWGVGLRVGVELVSALAVGVVIGWLLDRWLGTRPIFLGVFVLLGGAAGILNVWRIFAPRD